MKNKTNLNNYKFPIFILVVICMFGFKHKDQVSSIGKNLLPQRITSCSDMSLTLNQNTKYTLPNKVIAYYTSGKNKYVKIKWQSENIDTSTPGTREVFGEIAGYPRKIKFTAIILPHKVFNNISNCTIDNSVLEYNTQLSSNYNFILFRISKGFESKDFILPVKNGCFNGKVYLAFGKGKYYISILTNSGINQNGTYDLLKTIYVDNNDTRDTTFLLPDKNVESDSSEIIELAGSIVIGLKTDLEKTKAIHDWVASNVSYDTNAYFNNNIHEYSALETLSNKKALCNGYANLTAALNRAVGIKAKIIGGTALDSQSSSKKDPESHAWNETLINGKWIFQDTTWDAGGVDMKNKKFHFNLSHKYFNPDEDKFTNDHFKTSEN